MSKNKSNRLVDDEIGASGPNGSYLGEPLISSEIERNAADNFQEIEEEQRLIKDEKVKQAEIMEA